ncbi:ImcF-related family protein, partial [Pantoea vagans]|uniref:ImcF-related family protein n=1 Tax=Pantoea vagans TaxID=470934 RepID=UPI0035E3D3D0
MLLTSLNNHLRSRYNFLWPYKIRLLLVTGDDTAIEHLVPGLKQSQWLEGNRTVLIYGGSLTDIDTEKYTALRKLRRGRPLDGIIRVLDEAQSLTPQLSDNDLRGLEKIGEALRYSALVWIWQLCGSDWSQAGRQSQSVGITLPVRATPEDISARLDKLLPQLREQGLSQIAEHRQHDFLLRLAQQLEQGESKHWASRLTPWLNGAQKRVPLRGLMFSPIAQGDPDTDHSVDRFVKDPVTPSHPHALTFPAFWQGVINDCGRLRGRRVGMAWEQSLSWAIMILISVWGAGMLLSFALNYGQISSVAAKAHALAEHPTVSDDQLTALHDLRNSAGRLQHHTQNGSPWYQRFGLDHTQPLLSAMLPWYGVANNRLMRDPASDALTEKLAALANSVPESDQRAQLAKPGCDQLKAWLMMARPDKTDGAFYAQTMKTVQPTRSGISTALWQSLSPDLWAFYMSQLPHQPQWKITPDVHLVAQSRQVLLQQIGRRNAESTLYQNMLRSVRR